MHRLIDVKPLMADGWHLVKTGKSNVFLASMSLADVPTVDAVEVVHGHWNDDGRCTRCGKYMPFDCEGNAYESIYCPDCGAVMTER